MLFKKKQVLCSNCGFFCWRVQHSSGEGPYRFTELALYTRDHFQAGISDGTKEEPETQEDFHVCCLRNQWIWAPYLKGKPYYVNAEAVRQPRRCMYYINYEPAFGPEEHKELKREAEMARATLKASLIGAIIGASAAIVAQLVYAVFVVK